MNSQQYFQTTSLSCRLKAAQRELDSFRSGEAYVKLRKDYENIIRSLNAEIKKLQRERDAFFFTQRNYPAMDGCTGGCPKRIGKRSTKIEQTIAELLDMIASLKNRNAELDEKRKKALHDYYETAVKLEDAQGIIIKLIAQVNHNYENSSMPSPKCTGRKKIQTTGRKPAARKATRTIRANL